MQTQEKITNMWFSLAVPDVASQIVPLQQYPWTQTALSAVRTYTFEIPQDAGIWPSFDFMASKMANLDSLAVTATDSD
jgi:hypothetical protein